MAATAPATVSRRMAAAFWCVDRAPPEGPRIRTTYVKPHLAYVEAHWDRYAVAGPLHVGPHGAMTKSLFILHAETLDEAWAVMNGDPYVAEGLYAEVSAHLFLPAAGQWIGGKIW